MNRRMRARPARAALLGALLLAITVAISSAAPGLRFLPQTVARSVAAVATSMAALPAPTRPAWAKNIPHYDQIIKRPLRPGFSQRVPVWALPGQRPIIDLRRRIPGEATVQQVGAIGSTNDVTRLAVNQTTVPRPPQIGKSTISDDIEPVWAPDESWIYFVSNRANIDGTAVGPHYHIYRMTSDGNTVQQVTGMTGAEQNLDQLFPAIASNGLIAYSERSGPGAQSNIIVLNITNSGTRIRTQVTGAGLDPRYALGDALTPTWAPSSDTLALAANKAGVYNIYTINLRLGDVLQLTNGTTANGIDCQDPYWSSGGTLIAFDSNAAGVDAKTGLLSGTAPTRNIFVTYLTGPNAAGVGGRNTQPFVQMTNFPGANSIQPAFSLKVTGNAPNDTNNLRLLAFASQRGDPKNIGTADTVEPTYHLFWIKADNNKATALNTTDSMPEDPTKNPAVSIFTQDTDPNLPAASRYKANELHPSFPPFIRSIRVAYQSNLNATVDPTTGAQTFQAGGTSSNDIWTASFVDVNAPSLEAVNAGSGEIVRVARLADASPAPNAIGRREFTPGDQVVIMARAQDLESGIAPPPDPTAPQVPTIYAQIRNPNGKYQGADNKEHKTYWRMSFMGGGPAPQNPIANVMVHDMFNVAIPQEQSSEVIDTSDPRGISYSHPFFPNSKEIPPPPADPNNPRDPMCPPLVKKFALVPPWPNGPYYQPGIDDSVAWSGLASPPRGEWLPLYDDGPVSKGGHEPEGQVAGDGVFSNVWQTPSIPSDYIIDIVAYDKAMDPLGRGPGSNWKIYDNIWGFTTQAFIPQNNILAVMDYPEGQRFLSVTAGGRFTSGGATPVESYLLDLDMNLFPKTVAPMDLDACPPEMVAQLVSGSFGTKLGPLNTLGQFSFRNNGYDLWRVLCRGPVAPSILFSYAPTTETQIDPAAFNMQPSANGAYPTIQVPVAEKAVYWASPYSGDLWVGRGTITDAATQDMLTQFVQQKGGRLFITGQDIGWALTLNGTLQNNFFTNVLKAQFVLDTSVATAANPDDGWKLKSVTDAPVTNDWVNRDIASQFAAGIKEDPPDPYADLKQTKSPQDPLYILVHGTDKVITDGALDQFAPDKIAPIAPAIGAYTYYDSDPLPGTNTIGYGGLYYTDPDSGGRVVYLSFGLESLLREYDGGQNNQEIVLNYRSKLLHNALCWATTGELRGRVVDVSGLHPVAGAVVRAVPTAYSPNGPTPTMPNPDGAETRTAVTDANGQYIIRGLLPQPRYDLTASVPGFNSQHVAASQIHGIGEFAELTDLLVSRAAPGSITGTVTNSTGQPVPNALVVATLTAAPSYIGQVVFQASSNAQGAYMFGNLPTGSYTLTIDPTFLKNSGYSGVSPATQSAGVQEATNTSGVNFKLGGGTTPTPTPTPTPGTGGALKAFQPGLVLFSLPYDYPNMDAAAVLGLTPSDLTQKLATYATDSSSFQFYGAPLAKTLHLGRGYFVRLAKPATVTVMGTPAPANQTFSMDLLPGWNLIGDPFTGTVQWSSVKVQAGGRAPVTVAQALQQGLLKAGLLTLGGNPYRDSQTLDPWTGYWVRATQPVTLLIPPPGATVMNAARPLPAWQASDGMPPLP